MIRQAHTYLIGAMGGAMLIAIAIAVFVMLVSAQVLRNWPLGVLGGGEDAAVSKAQPAGGGGADAGADLTAGAGAGTAAGADAGRQARADLRDNAGSTAAGGGVGTATGGGRNATEPGGDGQGGTAGGSPQATGSPSAGGGGSASSGGGAAGGGGKAGGGSGGSTSSPSGQVTETVNNTVNQVDEAALGGTLGSSGVTEATEGVVNGVAGPDSTVGKVVDEAVGTVGGLLGQKP